MNSFFYLTVAHLRAQDFASNSNQNVHFTEIVHLLMAINEPNMGLHILIIQNLKPANGCIEHKMLNASKLNWRWKFENGWALFIYRKISFCFPHMKNTNASSIRTTNSVTSINCMVGKSVHLTQGWKFRRWIFGLTLGTWHTNPVGWVWSPATFICMTGQSCSVCFYY